MTGLKLARRAGVSPSYVSLIEHGEKVPSEKVAVRLARALDDREDLYRAWAATARMDEKTRRAVLALGTFQPSSPVGLPDMGERGITVPLLSSGVCPRDPGRLSPEEVETTLVIDGRLLARSGGDGLVAIRIDDENSRLASGAVRPGDVVVIDRFQESLAREGLLALRVDGRIHVARTRRLVDRLVVVDGGAGGELSQRDPSLAHGGDVADRVFGSIVWRARRVGRRSTGELPGT